MPKKYRITIILGLALALIWGYSAAVNRDVSPDKLPLKETRTYCGQKSLNTDYIVFVDFSRSSGSDRFIIYDNKEGKIVKSGICLHGSGKGNTREQPVFSNVPGSNCSSLGHYRITAKSKINLQSSTGLPITAKCLRLEGLDSSNSNAAARGITVHIAFSATVCQALNIRPKYMPLSPESEGCFAISNSCYDYLEKLIDNGNKNICIYAYN